MELCKETKIASLRVRVERNVRTVSEKQEEGSAAEEEEHGLSHTSCL